MKLLSWWIDMTQLSESKILKISFSCAEYGSERFLQFLELLGDEVQLRDWQQFRGGLDNKSE